MPKKLEKFESFREEPAVEVAETRAMRSKDGLTFIPQPIVDYFKARGAHVNLIYASPQNLAQESTFERYPVYLHELPEPIQKVCRQVFEDPEKFGGMLRRADCVVAWQSEEAQNHFRKEVQSENEAQDNYYANVEQAKFEEMLSKTSAGRKGFVQITPENVGRIRDYVYGGKEFAAEMEKQSAQKS